LPASYQRILRRYFSPSWCWRGSTSGKNGAEASANWAASDLVRRTEVGRKLPRLRSRLMRIRSPSDSRHQPAKSPRAKRRSPRSRAWLVS
jgi:hypothetical protein